MRPSLLRHLVCLDCRCELTLESIREEGDEVLDGFLTCDCGRTYPVIGGVPRMLRPELLAGLVHDYPEFYGKYSSRLPVAAKLDGRARVQRATQEAFGYEWTWAHDYQADNFADWLPDGLEAESLFADKLGLEVGCGAGRHAYAASALAQEHIAVDLSSAVDSAFRRLRGRPNCHVVQADAFGLPFREQSFDYVYCLGVLQHMHDPERGFAHLARYPREGGTLLVNVYQASRPITISLLAAARAVTTRLPNPVVRALSLAAGMVDYGLFIGPWKQISRTPLRRHLEPFVFERVREYARHDFHTCVIDWFDRLACPVKKHYTREQLSEMYLRARYDAVTVTPYWKAFWNGYGVRGSDERGSAEPLAANAAR
jgi:SAM-dependent methyltransferase